MNRLTCIVVMGVCVMFSAAVSSASGAGESNTPAAPATGMSPQQRSSQKYDNGIGHLNRVKQLAEQISSDGDDPKLTDQIAQRYEKAIQDFRGAIELDPSHVQAHSSLGYSLRMTGDVDAALESYGRALALDPTFTPAIEYRAEAYLGLGRYDDVREAYMVLFRDDRPRADELEVALAAWAEQHRLATGEGGGDATEREFATWIEARRAIAKQNPSTAGPSRGKW